MTYQRKRILSGSSAFTWWGTTKRWLNLCVVSTGWTRYVGFLVCANKLSDELRTNVVFISNRITLWCRLILNLHLCHHYTYSKPLIYTMLDTLCVVRLCVDAGWGGAGNGAALPVGSHQRGGCARAALRRVQVHRRPQVCRVYPGQGLDMNRCMHALMGVSLGGWKCNRCIYAECMQNTIAVACKVVSNLHHSLLQVSFALNECDGNYVGYRWRAHSVSSATGAVAAIQSRKCQRNRGRW